MKPFVREALTRFGAQVTDGEAERLAVSLPPEPEGDAAELAKHVESSFEVAFQSEALVPGAQLVAPGSHLLRVLEELLGPRGQRCYVAQPAEARLNLKQLGGAGLKPGRGLAFALEEKSQAEGHDVYVVFRLRYTTRERIDALETVRVRLRPGAAPLAELAEPPASAVDWEVRPRKRAPAEPLAAGLTQADVCVAERAREEARRLSQEARLKLGKDATRLHAYYAGQIAEYERRSRRRDLALLRIEELEEERALRLRELVAATHVAVEIEPLQLLEVEVPLATATLVVHPRDKAARVEGAVRAQAPLFLNRHTGELRVPSCAACQGDLSVEPVGGCAGGHVVHGGCLVACGGCGRDTCQACGDDACATCEEPRCEACLESCRGCEALACAEHRGACGHCQQAGCGVCLRACAACGTPSCSDHRQSAGEGLAASFCVACATPCAACRTATPQPNLIKCARCGRKFCGDCHPADVTACTLCLEG
jgi:hypothetical protein